MLLVTTALLEGSLSSEWECDVTNAAIADDIQVVWLRCFDNESETESVKVDYEMSFGTEEPSLLEVSEHKVLKSGDLVEALGDDGVGRFNDALPC